MQSATVQLFRPAAVPLPGCSHPHEPSLGCKIRRPAQIDSETRIWKIRRKLRNLPKSSLLTPPPTTPPSCCCLSALGRSPRIAARHRFALVTKESPRPRNSVFSPPWWVSVSRRRDRHVTPIVPGSLRPLRVPLRKRARGSCRRTVSPPTVPPFGLRWVENRCRRQAGRISQRRQDGAVGSTRNSDPSAARPRL